MQSFQEQDYTKRFDLSLWRKLIKVAKPYHKNLIAVVLFMAVSAIIDVIMPNMNAYAIDVFIANHSTAGLVGFVVAYALLTAVQVATIFGFLRQCGIVETGTCYLIRKLGFQKLQELPFSYYDRMPVGYLMSRLTNDTQRLADTIGWSLVDDITHAEVKEEKIIDQRYYHTIKEVKNGEGPHPIKTPKGWLHLAHGVRGCAAGLRYVLYMYMTSLEDPTKLIATPGGAFMVPEGEERIGDVSNVLFTNGWIADEDGTVFIYYASSDTRMHVATSTIDKLVDYCMNTPADGLSSSASVETLKKLIDKNLQIMK